MRKHRLMLMLFSSSPSQPYLSTGLSISDQLMPTTNANMDTNSGPRPVSNQELQEIYGDEIVELFKKNAANMMPGIMLKKKNIYATSRQFREVLNNLKAKKNIPKAHKIIMIKIHHARQRNGKVTRLYYRGQPWSDAKMKRSMKEDGVSPTPFDFDSQAVPEEISYSPQSDYAEVPQSLNPISQEANIIALTAVTATMPVDTSLPREEPKNIARRLAFKEQERVAASMTPENIWSHVSPAEQAPDSTTAEQDLHQRAFRLYEKHCGKGSYKPRKIQLLAEMLWDNERFSDAEELDRMTIELAEHYYGPDHPYTLTLKGNLAVLLDSQGKYNETQQLEYSVIESLAQSLGEDHEDTLWYKVNLSRTLIKQGKSEEAAELCAKVVKVAEKVLGCRHEHTLYAKFSLAKAYDDMNKWVEAKTLFQTVAMERNEIWGFSDKNTLQAYSALASTLGSLGRWEDAMLINEQVKRETIGFTSLWTLESVENVGRMLFDLEQYVEAEHVFRELVLKRTEMLTGRHPKTLSTRINVANTLHCQSKGLEATQIGNEVLTIFQDVLGSGHRSTFTVMANLAWYQYPVLKLEEFSAKMSEVLHLRVFNLGNDDPDSLHSQMFAAGICFEQGKFSEGENLYKETRRQQIRIFGTENHPAVIDCIMSHARSLNENGHHLKAEILLREASSLATKTFGAKNPLTLRIVQPLVRTLLADGQDNDVEELVSQSLATLKGILGVEHPQILDLMKTQAQIKGYLGNWRAAELLYLQVLKGYQSYGHDHPLFIFTTTQLAWSCLQQGKYVEAEQLYRRSINASIRCFGIDHPETLTVTENLAWVQESQRKYSAAVELQMDVVTRRSQALGPQYPTTLVSCNRLASIFVNMGNYQAAETLYNKVLTRRTRVLGPGHPLVIISISNLAWLHLERGDLAQAATLYRQVCEKRSETLGYWHPSSIDARGALCVVLRLLKCFTECQSLSREILDWKKSKYGENSPRIVLSIRNYALLSGVQGEYDEAEIQLQQALSIIETTQMDVPSIMSLMRDLADFYTALGRFSEALNLAEKVIVLGQTQLGSTPEIFLTQISVAKTTMAMKKFAEAEALIRQLSDKEKQNGGLDSPSEMKLQHMLSTCLLRQGKISEGKYILRERISRGLASGRIEESLRPFIEALGEADECDSDSEVLLEAVLQTQRNASSSNGGSCESDISLTLSNLSRIKRKLTKFQEAVDLQVECIKLKRGIFGEDSVEFWGAVGELAPCMTDHDRLQLNSEVFMKLIQLSSSDSTDALRVVRDLADTYQSLGDLGMAELLQKYVLYKRKAIQKLFDEDNIWDTQFLANTYYDAGKYDEAEYTFQNSVTAAQDLFGERNSTVFRGRESIAYLNHERGQFEAAESVGEEMLRSMRNHYSVTDIEHTNTLTLLMKTKIKLGKYIEAKNHVVESITIQKTHRGRYRYSLDELAVYLQEIDTALGQSPLPLQIDTPSIRSIDPPKIAPILVPTRTYLDLLDLLGPGFSATIPETRPLCTDLELAEFLYWSTKNLAEEQGPGKDESNSGSDS